ncbi:MAG: hypothetical protein M3R59_01330 [Verrucomicrobiota bacterium]|nr:hypothetical protein [Verrucomicrobiota bacterium]
MLKLSKDQTQKLVLGAIGFVALLYVYFSFFLGPLKNSNAETSRKIAELQNKIGSSKSELAKTTKLEAQAREATVRFAALRASSPEGAPLAWFPPRIKAFFADRHIERVSARLDSNLPLAEKELSNWGKYTWTIDVPQADFSAMGKAIADLENTQPLLAISKLGIHAGAGDDPGAQQVMFTATTLIDKK